MSQQLNEFSFRELLNKLFNKKDDTGSEDNMDNVANTGDITPGQSYKPGAISFADKYDRSPIKTYDLPPAKLPNPPGTENEPFDIADMRKQQAQDKLRSISKDFTDNVKNIDTVISKGTKDAYDAIPQDVKDRYSKFYGGLDDALAKKYNDNAPEWVKNTVDRYKKFYGPGEDNADKPQKPEIKVSELPKKPWDDLDPISKSFRNWFGGGREEYEKGGNIRGQ